MIQWKYLTILTICILLAYPVVATTTTGLMFEKSLDYSVTAIDTDEAGNYFYAGLSNGTIISFNNDGTVHWIYGTNSSIKEIKANSEGDIAWSNQLNETGIINTEKTVIWFRNNTYRNITEVSVSQDGTYYAFTELTPPRISIITQTGIIAQNTSYGIANWTSMAYDPDSNWIVTSNLSDNKLYLWNLSVYEGWAQFNPTYSLPKNTSQTYLDSFPYRRNLSLSNYNANSHAYFINNTSVTRIEKINNTYFSMNFLTTGKYLYLSGYGNMTDQWNVLNSSYFANDTLTLTFRPTVKNMTFYYGNASFTNSNFTGTTNYTEYTAAGSYTFTIPPGVTSVSYTLYGGGGGGSGCNLVTYYGNGGSASSATTGTLTIPAGQTNITVVVGGGGGSSSSSGSAGGSTTLNGTVTAAGGAGGTMLAGTRNGGAGANGYLTGARTSGTASDGAYLDGTCVPNGYLNGTSGAGYGAGGGGSASSDGPCAGIGASGAYGYANLSYSLPQITLGADSTASVLSTEQTRDTANSITYVTSQTLVGNVSALFAPNNGGWIAADTSSAIYHDAVSKTAFGTQYYGAAGNGSVRDLASSNDVGYSIEGRDLKFNIYSLDGTLTGTYTTGGIVNDVDISMINGLWAVIGGEDGQMYVASKTVSSDWYIFYQGESKTAIKSAAITWRGEMECIGREDGSFECYDNRIVSGTGINFNVFVYKNGAPYATYVKVEESAVYPYSWHTFSDNIATDTNGKGVVIDAHTGYYYKLTAGPELKEIIYTADSVNNQVIISIDTLEPQLAGRNYSATLTAPGNISILYTDAVTPNYVIIKVSEKATGKVVLNQQWNSQPVISTTYSGNPNIAYEIQWQWDSGGNKAMAAKTIYIPQGKGFTINDVNPYVKWATGYIFLMLVFGLFGRLNRNIGAIAGVCVYLFQIAINWLPATLWTIGGVVLMIAIIWLMGSAKEGSR